MVQNLEAQKALYTGAAEKAVTAIFTDQQQVDQAIRALLDKGVAREDISIVGRNFHNDTRVSGFLTRGDVIRSGLMNGAVYGAMFGSVLQLITGVGVLFLPFVGTVVVAGPLGAALLGAAGGAIAGSAGAGLASVLATMGMSEDKVNVYQTRVEAGEFVVVAEIVADRATEIEGLLREAGGEEIAVTNQTLPRRKSGTCGGPEELEPHVRRHLSSDAQKTFIDAYNVDYQSSGDEHRADLIAWESVRKMHREENGVWI